MYQKQENYKPLATVADDVNPEIAQLIDDCLRVDPNERPGSMKEVQQRIEDVLNPKYAPSSCIVAEVPNSNYTIAA